MVQCIYIFGDPRKPDMEPENVPFMDYRPLERDRF